MKVGIDIDGVIWDFAERIFAYSEWFDINELNKDGKKYLDKGEHYQQYDWTEEEQHKFFDEYEVKASFESNLMTLCVEVIQELKKMGNEIIIITARDSYNDRMIEIAKNMLEKENIVYDKIYWKAKNKVTICQDLGIDLMIDDKLSTCLDLAQNQIKCLYFKNRHGQEIKDNESIYTVTNWAEIYRYFINMNSN